MGEQQGRICLLCFLCLFFFFFFFSGITPPGAGMVFAADADGEQLSGAVELTSYKEPNYDHYIEESNRKTSRTGGPQHSRNIRGRGNNTTWCIVKPSTSLEKLDDIINYCCTQPRVDCKVIQPGGICYFPASSNKASDASVVMNIFYTLHAKNTFNCDFKGSGLIVSQDPSVGRCIYQV